MNEDRSKTTIEITSSTRFDEATADALRFDLAFALNKILRPSVLRELTKREPGQPLYDHPWSDTIAKNLVQRIRDSNWFVVRRPPSPTHSAGARPGRQSDD